MQEAKAETLIRIYLPEKLPVVGALIAAYAPFIQTAVDMELAALRGERLPADARQKIDAVNLAILKAGRNGLCELAEEARLRASTPHLVRWPWSKSS